MTEAKAVCVNPWKQICKPFQFMRTVLDYFTQQQIEWTIHTHKYHSFKLKLPYCNTALTWHMWLLSECLMGINTCMNSPLHLLLCRKKIEIIGTDWKSESTDYKNVPTGCESVNMDYKPCERILNLRTRFTYLLEHRFFFSNILPHCVVLLVLLFIFSQTITHNLPQVCMCTLTPTIFISLSSYQTTLLSASTGASYLSKQINFFLHLMPLLVIFFFSLYILLQEGGRVLELLAHVLFCNLEYKASKDVSTLHILDCIFPLHKLSVKNTKQSL